MSRPRGSRTAGGSPGAPLDSLLAPALPDYLGGCRWFGGKGRAIRGVRIVATWWLRPGAGHASLNLARVDFATGRPETYLLPVAIVRGPRGPALRERQRGATIVTVEAPGSGRQGPARLVDATADPGFWRDLLELFATGRRLVSAAGCLEATVLPGSGRVGGASRSRLRPRPCGAEQSNTSTVYGDELIIKLFRRLEAGVSPEVEVGGVLTARGFEHTPTLVGHLELRPPTGEPVTLAVLQRFVPNDGDAWRPAVAAAAEFLARARRGRRARAAPAAAPILEVVRDGSPAAVGAYAAAADLLGRRVAELHLTLAAATDDPAFAPERYTPPIQRAEARALRAVAARAFGLVRGNLPALAGRTRGPARDFLRAAPRVRARLAEFAARPLTVARIRGHGDLHLGQVLHAGGDFVIIDFEGEPVRPLAERRLKRAALRDVAGMLRSFHYAAFSALEERIASGADAESGRAALEPWAHAWQACVGGAFLRGYLRAARGSVLVPRDDDELRLLLDVYLLEKAAYEVAYEVEHRPAWLPIPLRAVTGLV